MLQPSPLTPNPKATTHITNLSPPLLKNPPLGSARPRAPETHVSTFRVRLIED
jgi:hypothetical protein